MESFDRAIWRFVWKDAIAGLMDKWRVIKEAAVSLSVGYVIFPLLGSADSTKDFAVEKLLVIPATLAVMMLVHALWSWVSGPRRLFYQKSERLSQLEKSEAMAVSRSQNQRLEDARESMKNYVIRAADVTNQHEMTAWISGAEDRVRGFTPRLWAKLFRAYPSHHAASPSLTSGDLVGLEKSVASLDVIARTLTLDDLG